MSHGAMPTTKLMTAAASLLHKSNGTASTQFLSDDPEQAKILIATTLAFLVGVIQVTERKELKTRNFKFKYNRSSLKICLAILHAGVVTKYLSDVIVAGFTTGAAYHIVVSQLGAILGISVHHDQANPFKLADVIYIILILINNLQTLFNSL